MVAPIIKKTTSDCKVETVIKPSPVGEGAEERGG